MRTLDADKIIKNALNEDIVNQDITTNYLIPKDHICEFNIIVKENTVICGLELAKKVFHALDKNIKFHTTCKDGDFVKKGSKIAYLKGKTRALLKGERVALNFLGYLSGIATKTRTFIKKIYPFQVKILDTRKTTPGLRDLEKYAVRCGGGINHRFNLKEIIFIKDNHREYHANLPLHEIIDIIKKKTHKTIIIEVDTLMQFKEAIKGTPDIILLDNMNIRQMKKAVEIREQMYQRRSVSNRKKTPLLEASGRISIKNVREVAKTGIDRISLGCLTHTHEAIDISMEIINRDKNK